MTSEEEEGWWQSPLRHTFMNTWVNKDTAEATIDTGACASGVGENTLDLATDRWIINPLEDKSMNPAEKDVDISGNAHNIVDAVQVSIFSTDEKKNGIELNVWFDVVLEDLPILIAFPSIRAMKATLEIR